MTFRFKDGKVEIDMVECTINMLEEFPVKFKETLEMPAGVDLFSEDNGEKLNEEMRTTFHRTVAQGLEEDQGSTDAQIEGTVKFTGRRHFCARKIAD